MFGKSDPLGTLKRWRVTLTTRGGETEVGSVLIPAHHTLREALNDQAPFLEIENEDGRHSFLLKTEVARIVPDAAARPRAADRGDEWGRFDAKDARVVLGVSNEATQQELQAAWRDLAKAYHPDRLAALGLPDEMLRHADRVLARINAAYQSLKNDAGGRGP